MRFLMSVKMTFTAVFKIHFSNGNEVFLALSAQCTITCRHFCTLFLISLRFSYFIFMCDCRVALHKTSNNIIFL